MSEKQSIQETLSIIRKALEDEDTPTTKDESNVLILNKMVKDDGTIQILEDKFIRKDEIKEILNQMSEQQKNPLMAVRINEAIDYVEKVELYYRTLSINQRTF